MRPLIFPTSISQDLRATPELPPMSKSPQTPPGLPQTHPNSLGGSFAGAPSHAKGDLGCFGGISNGDNKRAALQRAEQLSQGSWDLCTCRVNECPQQAATRIPVLIPELSGKGHPSS